MNFSISLTPKYYFLLGESIFNFKQRIMREVVSLSKTNLLYTYYTIFMKNELIY